MTKRIEIAPAPEPLEAYARHFDALLGKSNQRDEFRRYLEGLLLPSERQKTLTGLVNTEPEVGAQQPRAQKLQWFLSESTWDERQVQAERLTLLREDPATAPSTDGVLVIDETGDRKDGQHPAHVGRQYLANLGKIDNGVVSVTSLWADERVYCPVDVERYTPAHHFEKGKEDPQFRTKLKITVELVRRAVQAHIPFRAVVADSFYGVSRGVKRPRICGLYGPCKLHPVYADTGHYSLSVARLYHGLWSPRPQYSTSSSCFNYSLSWLIVQLKKAISGLLLDERTGVYRSIVTRCGAVGGGVLLLKLV